MNIIRRLLTRTTRAPRAAAIRVVAGSPVGLAPAAGSRRGTVLIIVLGTLALIAVIAVVYAVVGRADRRASAAFVGSVQREEMPTLVRDYIADVIGRDALATYRDGAGDLRREAFDYPYTDPMLRTIPEGQPGVQRMQPLGATYREYARFNPEGTFSASPPTELPPGAIFSLGSVGNPFSLLVPGDPWLSSTQPTNLRLDDDQPDNGYPQYNMRDWAQISNVAPDGRFVNLWNLRNNFASASGFDQNVNEISSRLTLLDASGLPYLATGAQILDDGSTTASPNRPAHWTMRQRGAFRPATGMPTIGWSEAEFLAYQWADADGDGFFDSRWFEFVDISQGVGFPRDVLPRDTSFRWFAAVRVADLSAAVNVNVATDFLAPPAPPGGNYAAPGGTPADIDLRRLLTGEDGRELAGGVGYDALRPPSLPGTSTVNPNSAQFTGLIDSPMAEFVGDAAYNFNRYLLEFGLVAPTNVKMVGPNYQTFINYLQQQHNAATTSTDMLRFQTVAGRRDWFDLIAQAALASDLSFAEFSVDAEAELLTFRGANDPSVSSTLELVYDGRFDDGSGSNPATITTRYGPLRSVRQAAVELAERDRSVGLINPGTLAAPNADGVADLDAMTQVLTDIRQHLTTISAARPLRSTRIATASPVPPLSGGDTLTLLSSLVGNPRSLFTRYADALLPYSGLIQTWLPVTDPAGESYRTLSYGHAGSELAIRHAAHLAVNLADAADSDDIPTVATVIVDEQARNSLNSDYDPPPPPGQNPTGTVNVKPMGINGTGRSNPWAAWVDGGNFDLTRPRIADSSGGATPIAPAFNVYGLEAQPFISEVAAIAMYTDDPGNPEPVGSPITIDGRHIATNDDLAFQAVAFQITNPFDTPIDLSGDAALLESKFYIEFGGRFYRIPDGDPNEPSWTGMLGARQTRVFYIPARPFSDDATRWTGYDPGAGSTQLNSFLDTTMGVNGAGPVQLSEFNPANGQTITFPAGDFVDRFSPVNGGTIAEARLWRTYLATGATVGGQPAETYAQNALQNDILADRFRDPAATPTLAPELDLTSDEVTGALARPPVALGEPDLDNGASILLWSTIYRPSDPEARTAPNADSVVWIPSYCLEPKYGPTLNMEQLDGLPRTTLAKSDLWPAPSRPEIALTFNDLLNAVTGGGSMVVTLAEEPAQKTVNDMGPNNQGEPWDSLLVEFHQDVGRNNARNLAPFDLLMAKGIGPSLEVDAALNTSITGWTTLGESMLLALDYDRGTLGANVVWAPNRPQAAPGSLDRGSLDRGHLILDAFVPFFDSNPNGQPFDPANDIAYGDAQPAALGIVGTTRSLSDNYGSFRRGTPGVININTAPLTVLRTLPMLSPTHGRDPKSVGGEPIPGSAWWGNATGQGLGSDVASTIAAYRDLLTLFPRGDAFGNPPLPGNDILDFSRFTNPVTPRGTVAGVDGVRELPGFRSIGEVLNARIYATRTGGVGQAGLHDIDRLGLDGARLNMPGFDPVVYSIGGTPQPDPLIDEFDERLVLANSIANTISVRSDTYAVWFVLHGYRESDCTGLATDDPLIPSVSRRFLMILDRSSVVAPGDKPSILLFREVPYSPTTAGDGSAI